MESRQRKRPVGINQSLMDLILPESLDTNYFSLEPIKVSLFVVSRGFVWLERNRFVF
jgi:hypothetical protein